MATSDITDEALGAQPPAGEFVGADTQLEVSNRVMERLFGREPESSTHFGRYRVDGRLGQGAMGTVYSATDPELDRRVAIKVLHAELADRERALLTAEARAMARLHHPNVVAVYDVGERDGQVFVAMEWINGSSLSVWATQTRPGWRAIATVYRDAARGLVAAHEAGLVHRDFKPDNVLVADDGRAAVADFGLARPAMTLQASEQALTDGALGDATVSSTRSIAGTPAYLAPEVIQGAPGNALSDQFSFCVSLYETLYGRRPFEGNSVFDLMTNICTAKPAPPPADVDVPRRLWAVVERGLSPLPAQRFASMVDLVAGLDKALVPWRRRIAMPVIAVAIAGSGLGGAALYQQVQHSQCDEEALRVRDVWSPATRDQVRAALVGTGAVYATATWQTVDLHLSQWSDRWAQGRGQACEGRGEDAWAARRTDCYEGALAELQGLSDALSTSSADVVAKATRAALDLSEPDRCRDDQWLRSAALPPPSAEAAKVASETRRELARARTLKMAGRYDESMSISAEQLERARAIDHPPLIAEALLSTGVVHESRGDFAASRSDLEAAYALATEIDAPRLAASAGVRIAWLLGVRLRHHEAGQAWAAATSGFLKRTGPAGATIQARRLETLSRIHLQRGELEQALEEIERARALADSSAAPDSPLHDRLATAQVAVHNEMADFDKAAALVRRTIDRVEAREGPVHPALIPPLSELLKSAQGSGETDVAERAGERALDMSLALYGENHVYAAMLTNSAIVARDRGDWPTARDHLERALKIQRRQFPDGSSEVLATLANLSVVAKDANDVDSALRYSDEAVKGIEDQAEQEPDTYISALINRGVLFMELDRHEQAVPDFARALERAQATVGEDHPTTAILLYNLARTDVHAGNTKAGLERLAQVDRILAGREEADAWLTATRRAFWGILLESVGRHAEAEPVLRSGLGYADRLELNDTEFVRARFALARILAKRGERSQARELTQRALRDASTIPGAQADAQRVIAEIRAWKSRSLPG